MQDPMYPAKDPSAWNLGTPISRTQRYSPSLALQPKLHPEWLPPIKCQGIGCPDPWQVFCVHSLRPAETQFGRQWPSSEVEPGLVEVRAALVRVGHPDQHWSRIRHQTEPFLALSQRKFHLLPFRDVHTDSEKARHRRHWLQSRISRCPQANGRRHRSAPRDTPLDTHFGLVAHHRRSSILARGRPDERAP